MPSPDVCHNGHDELTRSCPHCEAIAREIAAEVARMEADAKKLADLGAATVMGEWDHIPF